jgi:hypothetical protein
MKSLLVAVVILAFGALSSGEGAAQMSSGAPSGMDSSSAALGGMGSTSPVGTGPGGFAPNPQIAALPYSGTVSPCPTPREGTAALPDFSGSSMSISANPGISDAIGDIYGFRVLGTFGVGTGASTTCESASSSGIVNSPASTSMSGTVPSPLSTSVSTGTATTPASATPSTPEASGLGIGGLGVSRLGTAGLGTAGLSASPEAAASPGPSRWTSLAGSTAFCSGTSAETNAMSGGVSVSALPTGGNDASGAVPNAAQGLAIGIYNPAQTLGGEAGVPSFDAVTAPCISGE